MNAGSARLLVALAALMLATACASTPEAEIDATRAADANAALGIDFMRKGENEAALKKLRRALSYDDEHFEANWALAVVHERMESYDKADQRFLHAIDIQPSAELLNSYGAFLCGRGRTEEAISHFERAARNPNYRNKENALANAGVCLARAGRLDSANDFLRRALAIDPGQRSALAQMARLKFAAGEHLGARAFFQRRDAERPMTDDLLLLAARNELALGERDEARRYLRRYNDADNGADRTLDELGDGNR